MHIIPIASGKGGVGKSLIAANLSIALGQAGKKVCLADLDLGGSNLHLILGTPSPSRGIGTYLSAPNSSFEELVSQTDYENLFFIPGDAEIPGIANLQAGQRNKIVRKLMGLEMDYLILDLGAGTNFNILDFFLMSNKGIIITTPTPTATVNAYLFLKNIAFRQITVAVKKDSAAADFLDRLKRDGTALQRVYIPKLLEHIKSADQDTYTAYLGRAARFHPRLILNMLENPDDTEKANKLRRSCQQYLDIDMEHLGIIYRDDLQDTALRSRLPIILYKPQSVLAQAIYRIADKIIQSEDSEEDADGAEVLVDLDESYQNAESEASSDFAAKLGYLEELMQAGALTMGDLIETVKTQQIEINHLKKENRFLKSKILKSVP
ncbi:MAG: P-loop NTPase [Spirochaetales bacterium]|jgi:flagellar biosynthesis protein FlhG|nr:P-loop NTPase [Spirochaetales bacterium]